MAGGLLLLWRRFLGHDMAKSTHATIKSATEIHHTAQNIPSAPLSLTPEVLLRISCTFDNYSAKFPDQPEGKVGDRVAVFRRLVQPVEAFALLVWIQLVEQVRIVEP